jgi:hypothetical protein
MAGRRLWRGGEYDAAMKHYRKVMILANINPRMGIVIELNKDGLAIDHRGAPLLKAALDQYGRGELDEAEESVRQIHKMYRGFETARQARELFDKISATRQAKIAAAKAAKKDTTNEPPASPVAGDEPKVNDKKEDDDKKEDAEGDKKGDEDGEYEDDF